MNESRSNWRQAMPTPQAYWLGKVLFELHHKPDDLDQFKRDANAYLERYPLSAPMRRAIIDNDIAELYRSGVNPYLLRAHCVGMRIPEAASLAALRSAGGDSQGGAHG
jgi:Aromatic-ring-opening dioxygenase LigAB, LigA subunit